MLGRTVGSSALIFCSALLKLSCEAALFIALCLSTDLVLLALSLDWCVLASYWKL